MKVEDQLPVFRDETDDEIDLRDIILPIWKAKYRIILVSLLFAGLVFGYHLFRYSYSSPSQHSVTVNFNFDGVEKGIYPNGAVFSPNDLVSNNVLRRVFDELRLAEKQIEFSTFASALTIKSGFSGEGLLKSSAAEIASKDKKITVEAFNKLVATYTRAINTYSRQNAVLTLDNGDLHFGQSQAEAVLLKIPEVWAEYSIQELGVMVVFSDIVTVNVKKGLGVEPLVMVNKLADYANLLTGLITELKTQPRANSIVDKTSGYTINDLSYQLSQVQKYQVNTLRSVITNNKSYSNNVGLHESFRSGQLDKLQRDKGELVRLINVYDDISAQFDQMASRRGHLGSQKDTQNLSENTIYSPQYGDALVNNLLELGGKMADPEFRKTLLNQKISLSIKLQKVETEIEIFSSSSSSSKTIPKAQILGYISKAADELTEVADAIRVIVNSYNSYAFNQQGSLYTISGEIKVAEGYGLNDAKIKLKVILGFILGGMLAVFWVWGRRLVS